MNYLAIDTSNKNLTVIIKKDGKVYKYFDTECGVSHSVDLMPKVEQLAKTAQFDFASADFFACVVGAGSFTGIRIGVSTIKAMCFAFNKPCLSITSFDTLAYNISGDKVMAMLDAKHDGFYVCGYDQDKKVVLPPQYLLKDEAFKLAKGFKVVSDQKIKGIRCKAVSVAEGLICAIEQKQSEVTFDLESLIPLYVRKSQAEEGR